MENKFCQTKVQMIEAREKALETVGINWDWDASI
jgi:hypothetical protein